MPQSVKSDLTEFTIRADHQNASMLQNLPQSLGTNLFHSEAHRKDRKTNFLKPAARTLQQLVNSLLKPRPHFYTYQCTDCVSMTGFLTLAEAFTTPAMSQKKNKYGFIFVKSISISCIAGIQ